MTFEDYSNHKKHHSKADAAWIVPAIVIVVIVVGAISWMSRSTTGSDTSSGSGR